MNTGLQVLSSLEDSASIAYNLLDKISDNPTKLLLVRYLINLMEKCQEKPPYYETLFQKELSLQESASNTLYISSKRFRFCAHYQLPCNKRDCSTN
jgi:hypothetical protein